MYCFSWCSEDDYFCQDLASLDFRKITLSAFEQTPPRLLKCLTRCLPLGKRYYNLLSLSSTLYSISKTSLKDLKHNCTKKWAMSYTRKVLCNIIQELKTVNILSSLFVVGLDEVFNNLMFRHCAWKFSKYLNPFRSTDLLLYSLKTSENERSLGDTGRC